MSIAVIPDMHGSTNWKCVMDSNYDYLVSLGDWFDGEGTADEQIQNFIEFMEYVKKDPSKRFALIGNHDYQYITPVKSYTGKMQFDSAEKIGRAIRTYLPYMRIVVVLNGIAFSHAGLTKTWMRRKSVDLINAKILAKDLNFIKKDYATDDSGNDVYQGPLWVRPPSLLRDSAFEYQVVGHTCLAKNKTPVFAKFGSHHVIFTDSFTKDCVIKFDSDNVDCLPWQEIYNPEREYYKRYTLL